jgi:hypothetical protein
LIPVFLAVVKRKRILHNRSNCATFGEGIVAKGKGMRVPDNQYRYRTDAPIEEYFRNWGKILGQMHALTK